LDTVITYNIKGDECAVFRNEKRKKEREREREENCKANNFYCIMRAEMLSAMIDTNDIFVGISL